MKPFLKIILNHPFLILITVLTIGLTPATGQEVGQTERLISPEINPDNSVTFRINAPKATSVEVTGNWMPMISNEAGGMMRKTLVLTKDNKGIWSAKSEVLAPELYGYSFLVDGVTTLDPSNL